MESTLTDPASTEVLIVENETAWTATDAAQASDNGTSTPVSAPSVYPVEMIEIAKIQMPANVRVDWEHLDILEDSLRNNRQLQAIGVVPEGEHYGLLWGHNRVQAARNIGWTHLRAEIRDYAADDPRRELVVLEENFVRDELNHLEYAEALGRMKEIYEQLYPRTRHGKGRTTQDPEAGSCVTQRPAFLDEKSRQLGWSRSKVHDYVYLYKRLLPEVRAMIRTHEMVHNLSALKEFAHADTNMQLGIARLLQHEPQMTYYDASRQVYSQRGVEKPLEQRDDLYDTTDDTADEKLSSDDQSVETDNEWECPSTSLKDKTTDPEGKTAQEEEPYVDPLQAAIDDAEKLDKEFYDVSKLVRQRGAFTLNHVLNRLYHYCNRFSIKNYSISTTQHHNEVTIIFKPFETPEAFNGILPEKCPGWRLYNRLESVCKKCPHQKPCFSAQVVPKATRITQMDYYEYKQKIEQEKQLDRMFRRSFPRRMKKPKDPVTPTQTASEGPGPDEG